MGKPLNTHPGLFFAKMAEPFCQAAGRTKFDRLPVIRPDDTIGHRNKLTFDPRRPLDQSDINHFLLLA